MTVPLVGHDTTVEYDGHHCRLIYRDADTGGWLRRQLGEITIPVSALAGVEVCAPGVLRSGRLTLVPRPGADPFAAVTGDSLDPDQSPYGIEFPSAQEAAASALAERLAADIAENGLAAVTADEFLVEVPRPPLSARGRDGWVEFDGDRVALWREGDHPRGHTLPVAALQSVSWVEGNGRHDDYLRFHLVGDDLEGWHDPRRDPRCLRYDTTTEKAETLVLAVAVAVHVQRFHGETRITAAGLPHGLQVEAAADGSLIRLHGVAGSAEFDGDAVIMHTQGVSRRIPLPAIDHLELSEDERGTGYLRVHLAGAGTDSAAFEPVLDVNTVCHDNEPAALEFTLRVTAALREVTQVPDPALLDTAGPRPDLADALPRASVRVRGMVPELAALPAVLGPKEYVRELDLAVSEDVGEAGLLALTDRRLLFLAAGEPHGDPVAVGVESIETVRATWNDAHVGRLVFVLENGAKLTFQGVHNPARFRELPDPPEPPKPRFAVEHEPGLGPEWVSYSAPGQRSGQPARPDQPDQPARSGQPAEADRPAAEGTGTEGPRIRLTNAPSWLRPPDYARLRPSAATPSDSLATTSHDPGLAALPDGRPDHDVERALLRADRRASPPGRYSVPGTDVEEARRRAAPRSRGRRRELDDVLYELFDDEQVYELEAAFLEGQDGLLVLTSLRLLFVSGDELLKIPMEAVRQTGAYDGLEELNVETADRLQFRFFRMYGPSRFARAINQLGTDRAVRRPSGQPVRPPSEEGDGEPVEGAGSVQDQIKMLGELYRSGLLTEREFQRKRAQLLRRS